MAISTCEGTRLEPVGAEDVVIGSVKLSVSHTRRPCIVDDVACTFIRSQDIRVRKQTLVLWSIVILSGALALAMLTKGHDWGDDFAAYIMQAAGIVHGTVREPVAHMAFTMRESYRAYGPIADHWGFPTLLAPFYLACGGLNIFCLKLINVLFFAFFLIAWFALLTRRLSLVDSAIALSILAFNPALLSFQNNVLSDITFLFFSTLSVLLIDKVIVAPAKPEGSLGGNVCLYFMFLVAFSFRPNGIVLF